MSGHAMTINRDAHMLLTRFTNTTNHHVYCEGNQVANNLATYGHGVINQCTWEREYDLLAVILSLVKI